MDFFCISHNFYIKILRTKPKRLLTFFSLHYKLTIHIFSTLQKYVPHALFVFCCHMKNYLSPHNSGGIRVHYSLRLRNSCFLQLSLQFIVVLQQGYGIWVDLKMIKTANGYSAENTSMKIVIFTSSCYTIPGKLVRRSYADSYVPSPVFLISEF